MSPRMIAVPMGTPYETSLVVVSAGRSAPRALEPLARGLEARRLAGGDRLPDLLLHGRIALSPRLDRLNKRRPEIECPCPIVGDRIVRRRNQLERRSGRYEVAGIRLGPQRQAMPIKLAAEARAFVGVSARDVESSRPVHTIGLRGRSEEIVA